MVGIVSGFTFQVMYNITMSAGLAPVKGLTLPLMSYGRSSLVVTLAWVGLLLRVYHEAMAESRGSATVRRGGARRSNNEDADEEADE